MALIPDGRDHAELAPVDLRWVLHISQFVRAIRMGGNSSGKGIVNLRDVVVGHGRQVVVRCTFEGWWCHALLAVKDLLVGRVGELVERQLQDTEEVTFNTEEVTLNTEEVTCSIFI